MSEKWWDMSDDELDDLFRDASDKVDIPFESSSFDKLRQKIDIQRKPEPPQGYKSRWLVLLAGLFLMVGVGLVYYSVHKEQSLEINSIGNNSTEIVGNIEQKSVKKLLKPSSSVSSKTDLNKEIKKESNLLIPENLPNNLVNSSEQTKKITEKSTPSLLISPETPKNNNVGQPTISANEKIKETAKETKSASSQLASVGNTEKQVQIKPKSNLGNLGADSHGSRNKTSVSTNSSPAEIALAVNRPINNRQIKASDNIYYNADNQTFVAKKSKNNKVKKGKNNALNPIISEQNTLPIIENLAIIPEKITSEETVNRTNFYNINDLKNKDSKPLLTEIYPKLPNYLDSLPRTAKPVKFSRFGVRFVLSPDMNSIENLGKTAFGGSVGVLFEYKITNKLTVQTGMVYSNKNYVGSFDDYHNWKEWKGYHPSKPTEVDGGCTVFDIPINLRLNLFQKPKQTWFVSSGVSSYWMISETYTYIYAWGPPKAVDWNDNSNYYFSVLNFSVGFDKQISKHFSFQVEPYLKTPLKNVGRGGVNLYSSGILFSTKYQF